jgi:mRNA interferase MazF
MIKGEIWWADLPYPRGSEPANIHLEKAVSKLPKPSVANFSQILTVDKSYFISLVSMMSKPMLEKIDESIKIIFDVH